jgi:tetratricopeptide (TPR) repeat protein
VIDLEHYRIPDQLNLLFKELNEASYLLVLDNFEVLLNPQTDKPLESKIGFSDLIEKANENCIRSKILFTSWDSIFSERGLRLSSISIGGLDTSAGILLLKREGVTESDSELKKAIELSGGHPLALVLLAQLINEGADTLSALLNDDSLWIGKDGEVAENILNKVYIERLSEDERELLQYISIFRQPVPAKAIVAIANDSKWSEPKVKRVAVNLTRKSLLQKQLNRENYWEESLVSKYAATRLAKKSECHKLACNYFFSIPVPAKTAKKEDVQSLIEAHYHACMAEEYDKAFNIVLDYDLHEKLFLWGNYIVLVELYLKMLPEDHFGNVTLLEDKKDHGAVLGSLGIAYYQMGDAKKAIDYYEQALKIDREIGDTRGEGADLGNLGNAYRALGDAKKAIDYYEQALKISREIGDIQGEGAGFGNLGTAYFQLGDAKKAINYYEQALKIDRKIGDIQGKGTDLCNLGIAYFQLGDARKAINYYEQALKISREIGDIQREGVSLGNLGNAYRTLGDARKAINCYEQALKISREIGDIRGEGADLGNLGTAYCILGDVKKAIDYYEQALKISREIGDRWGEGNHLGNLGIAYHALGDGKKAIELLKESLTIGELIEDPRIISFCEQKLKELEGFNE